VKLFVLVDWPGLTFIHIKKLFRDLISIGLLGQVFLLLGYRLRQEQVIYTQGLEKHVGRVSRNQTLHSDLLRWTAYQHEIFPLRLGFVELGFIISAE
jgi:hypothetical protein